MVVSACRSIIVITGVIIKELWEDMELYIKVNVKAFRYLWYLSVIGCP